MLNSILNSTSMPLLEKAAVFSERRQAVLAGNIANIATPNYRTRDLPVESFSQAMKKAIASRNQSTPTNLQTLSPSTPLGSPSLQPVSSPQKSIDQFFTDDLFQSSDRHPHNLTYQDRGNRSIEHEVMEMTKNSMMQGYVTQLMISQMNLLQSVISEQP